ncbi:ESX secretion-associated protein EspG [Nocardia cyriacigeorgica]|uniref:ESX secretion-associated protein EspG n=1 Tax=Nocardia cyriacigeorgica TaxID=135487 RepID=UPI0013B84B0C|nr:ESX secretion-associated protein EspG [Nocardia cyriacigeorgica]NEW51763.1 ESX secretion-associated protein EspG [Nocardia cyriacigeorgica]
MSEYRWQLDGLAFTIALEVLGRDRLPYPLSFRPELVEHLDDYERMRMEAGQRLQRVFDERFYNALSILLEPQVRVEVEGFYGPQQSQVARVHAGVVDNVATIAVQQSGPTREHGRDIIITQCRSTAMAAEIVGKLPRYAGGSHRAFRARRSELNQPVYSRHPTRLSPAEEMNRFFRRPRIGTGEITVYPGYTLDARPTDDGRAFIWLDYPDDGRYLLHHHSTEDLTVTPGPPDEIVRQLQERLRATAAANRQPQRVPDPAEDEDDLYYQQRNERGWLV